MLCSCCGWLFTMPDETELQKYTLFINICTIDVQSGIGNKVTALVQECSLWMCFIWVFLFTEGLIPNAIPLENMIYAAVLNQPLT